MASSLSSLKEELEANFENNALLDAENERLRSLAVVNARPAHAAKSKHPAVSVTACTCPRDVDTESPADN